MNSAPIETSVGDSAGHATRVTDLGSGNIKKVTVSDPQRHGSGVNSYVVSPAHRTAGCHLLSQLCLLVSSSVSPPAAAAAAAGRTHKYARTRFLALAFTTTSHLFSPHPTQKSPTKSSQKQTTKTLTSPASPSSSATLTLTGCVATSCKPTRASSSRRSPRRA